MIRELDVLPFLQVELQLQSVLEQRQQQQGEGQAEADRLSPLSRALNMFKSVESWSSKSSDSW